MRPSKYFKVVRHGKGFRLMHKASGDYVQRYLCDFMMHKDAIACRNAIMAAAPEWDWNDVNLFQDMPCSMFDRVWAAIYARRA